MQLSPDPIVTPADVERGKRALVRDAAWASMVGALYGGVILVGFALELGATPWHIGLLAALPFLAQLRSEEHTSELQSQFHLVCRLLLEKKKKQAHPTRFTSL